jgi:hypothetical protein
MNKKKIFGSLAILAITAIAAINIYVNTKDNNLSGLSNVSLSNIEALAFEYPTLECLYYCQWDPHYICSVYVLDAYGIFYHYLGDCDGYKG